MLQRVISASDGAASIRDDMTLNDAHAFARDFYDRLGGAEFFRRLTEEFYRRVADDNLLAPLFKGAWADHAARLAHHFIKVYGIPDLLEAWEPHVLAAHTRFVISHKQRLRWLDLMEASGHAIKAPQPEFGNLMAVLGVASLDMLAASRGAGIARGERFDRIGEPTMPDDPGGDDPGPGSDAAGS